MDALADLLIDLHLDVDVGELVGEVDDDKVFPGGKLLWLQEVVLAKGGMVHLHNSNDGDGGVDGDDDHVGELHLVGVEGKPCGLDHLVASNLENQFNIWQEGVKFVNSKEDLAPQASRGDQNDKKKENFRPL